MLEQDFLKQLKQVNISKDGEKTKVRFKEVWKAASSTKKNEVKGLAGVAQNTIYRVGNTGSISAKLALAIAQVLNINPLYLTGEANEVGEYTDKSVNSLLRKHGYDKKSEKKPRGKRNATEAKDDPSTEQNEIFSTSLSKLNKDVIANLSGDKIMNLFESLRTKVSAGVPGSQEKIEKILELLLY